MDLEVNFGTTLQNRTSQMPSALVKKELQICLASFWPEVKLKFWEFYNDNNNNNNNK